MVHDNVLKVIFGLGLVTSLIFYHLTSYFKPVSLTDFYDVFKIAQATLSAIFGFIIVFNPVTTRFFLRNRYIAGNYMGKSSEYSDEEGKLRPEHIEQFIISQNIFETIVSGQSFQKNSNELIATWEGKLIKIEGSTFIFALELSSKRQEEFGTLKLSVINKNEMVGFYYSGNPKNKNIPKFYAKKV